MRKQRQIAPGGGQNLGRVGALGVLAAGALCAAVVSVASRVPPTPINTERIPGVEIGSATNSDVTPADAGDRHGRRSGKGGSRGRGGSRGKGARAGGSALPVVYRDSGGGGTDRRVPGGPRGGSGGDGPGARGDGGDGGRQPGPGGRGGAQARDVPAPAPAPAPGQPAGGEEAIDDDNSAAPTRTEATEDDDDVEVEAVTAPAAAIPGPTLARSGDSDDE
jgi:hypothetical protein